MRLTELDRGIIAEHALRFMESMTHHRIDPDIRKRARCLVAGVFKGFHGDKGFIKNDGISKMIENDRKSKNKAPVAKRKLIKRGSLKTNVIEGETKREIGNEPTKHEIMSIIETNLLGKAADIILERFQKIEDANPAREDVVLTKSEGFLKGEAYPCGCHKCTEAMNLEKPETTLFRKMILCSKCGNKRCPHATDHELDCSGSNDPGQKGSVYE